MIRRIRVTNADMLCDAEVEPLGDGRFRMLEHPLLTEGLGLHDVIEAVEAEDGALQVVNVVERGPWRTLFFGVSREMSESEALSQHLAAIEQAGVHWDRAFGGGLWVHVRRGSYPQAVRELVAFVRPGRRCRGR